MKNGPGKVLLLRSDMDALPVTEQTGLPARISTDALEAVAKGALICLEHLDEWHKTLEASDDER